MGYSLRTALAGLRDDAEVVMAEIVPAVVKWNREFLGHLAGHPLRDPRVTVRQQDVGLVIGGAKSDYDAILLDVDNGPEGLTRKANDDLYSRAGLLAARSALRPQGVLGIWSSGPNRAFVQRLRQSQFEVEEIAVRTRGRGRGARHTIWLAVPRP
jgi:spermidine synthase